MNEKIPETCLLLQREPYPRPIIRLGEPVGVIAYVRAAAGVGAQPAQPDQPGGAQRSR